MMKDFHYVHQISVEQCLKIKDVFMLRQINFMWQGLEIWGSVQIDYLAELFSCKYAVVVVILFFNRYTYNIP